MGGVAGIFKEQDIPFAENAPTAPLSTFRIGGTCRYLIMPRCHGELLAAIGILVRAGLAFAVIGQGSNLLFDDGCLNMALIRTTALSHIQADGAGGFVADCGASLPRLSRMAAQKGYADLAFAAGIPGTVGGGVLMNAGAHGRDLAPLVKSVTALEIATGEIKTYFNQELAFSYRNSIFQQDKWVILRASLACTQYCGADVAMSEMRRLQAHRAATQPLAKPSAGSVFRRTADGVSMGYIIDKLGMKGLRCGGAAVSEKHAGFIVNQGGATAEDYIKLINCIKSKVYAAFGVELEEEIEIIG